MKGSIRFFLGMLMVFGAVGALDAKPDAALGTVLMWAAVGLMVMKSGADALAESND